METKNTGLNAPKVNKQKAIRELSKLVNKSLTKRLDKDYNK